MTYYLLVTCVALATFLALNVVGTLGAAALWLSLRGRARRWTANARATVLFWMSVIPPACALLYVAGLLVPAFLSHERYSNTEAVGLPLLVLASCSALVITLALCRAAASWLITRRLTHFWLSRSEPLNLKGVAAPAFLLRHSTPVLAVVGTLRPRLFVTAQVLDSLSPEELEMALAHERGHLLARDTLKRAVMHVCRNLLPFFGAGRVLERFWAQEAEEAADEYAACSGSAGALDLAAALIKIARLMPADAGGVAPVGAFLIESAEGGLAGRVMRLTEIAQTLSPTARMQLQLTRAALLWGLAGLVAVSLFIAADGHILASVQDLTEKIVRLLS